MAPAPLLPLLFTSHALMQYFNAEAGPGGRYLCSLCKTAGTAVSSRTKVCHHVNNDLIAVIVIVISIQQTY